ncbi:MAG: site-2 protease family protein [Elusimicrobia bacterium]|nr:site-2 protease family protein [Elusimicrobiota bacterium]
MEWVIQLPILFFSVVIHEFCHGVAAYERGDDTAEKAGRLTLNPFPHVDPFGTLVLPLVCLFSNVPVFAFAKPVPIDPSLMKRPRLDEMLVAAVGPVSNVLLAFLAAVAYKLVNSAGLFAPAYQATVLEALLFAMTMNLFLAFFNLVPVHPLDGSKVLAGLLPEKAREAYRRLAGNPKVSLALLAVLLFTPAIKYVVLLPMKLVLALWVKVGIIG